MSIYRAFFLTFVIGLLSMQPTLSHSEEAITNALAKIHSQIQAIQKKAGKTRHQASILVASGATLNEVMFATRGLYIKVNRLSLETVGTYQQLPKLPTREIEKKDILNLLNKTSERLDIVSKFMKIDQTHPTKHIILRTSASGYLNELILLNDQTNNLLKEQITPADVYEQVTTSILYLESIYSHLNLTLPQSHFPIKAQMTPKDVFKKLLLCISILQKIGKAHQVDVASIKTLNINKHYILPHNVIILAKIIKSDLRVITQKMGADVDIHTYYPGHKIPGDVYAKASYLESLLNKLNNYQQMKNQANTHDKITTS